MIKSPPFFETPWWRNRPLLVALCLATALPVLVTSVPPLIDYFSHLGHYRIQTGLADSPLLQRNWDFHWALIPNLGVDLLVELLTPLLGLERAAWLIALIIPPLMAIGFVRTAKAAHGEVPPTLLAALPFVLAYPFQFGFMNYWLGTAIAFNLFATWLLTDASRPWRKALLFVPASLMLWVVHAFAWGILGVLAGGAEIGRAWKDGERRMAGLLLRPALRCWPLLPPLLLMAVWRTDGEGGGGGGAVEWIQFIYKVTSFIVVLRDQWMPLDIASICAVVLLVSLAFLSRRLSFHPILGIPALALFALAVFFPYKLFGIDTGYTRLWPIVIATALLAVRIDPETPKVASWIAVIALTLLLIRIGVGTAGFAAYDRDSARHLAALDQITPGSRVVVLVGAPCGGPWRSSRLQHLGSMAIVRRDAFTNTQWSLAGAHLVKPLGGANTPFNVSPSEVVRSSDCPDDLRPLLYQKMALIPRDRFDYVWVIDFNPATLTTQTGLQPLFSDTSTILYQIDGSAAQ
jgi:hypothetical protein